MMIGTWLATLALMLTVFGIAISQDLNPTAIHWCQFIVVVIGATGGSVIPFQFRRERRKAILEEAKRYFVQETRRLNEVSEQNEKNGWDEDRIRVFSQELTALEKNIENSSLTDWLIVESSFTKSDYRDDAYSRSRRLMDRIGKLRCYFLKN